MTTHTGSKWVAVLAGVAAGVIAHGAAEADNWHCESTAMTWDAPYGSIVVSRSQGPIGSTLSTIGESVSHIVLSIGAHWATQAGFYVKASANEPEVRSYPDACTRGPFRTNELKTGVPGAQMLTASGMWAFYLNDPDASLEWIGRIMPGPVGGVYPWDDIYAARDAADFLNYDVGWFSSGSNRYQASYGGETFPYVLKQYYRLNGRHKGDRSWLNGVHCASWVAWAVAKGTGKYIDRVKIEHEALEATGTALYGSVKSTCEESQGWEQRLGAIACAEASLCDDAARQVRRCMVSGSCGDDDNDKWYAIKNDSSSYASSISPAKIAGLGPHPGTFNGINSKKGPWSYYPAYGVTFSGGGTWYGCW